MKKTFFYTNVLVFIAAYFLRPPSGLALEPVDETLPMVGTGGHAHTYPGATVPFGFVQLSPDTHLPTEPWTVYGWDACGGYHYADHAIMGFSHTHISGTGCPELGDVLIMPIVCNLNESDKYLPMTAERFKSEFSHDKELAQPGYYRVRLDRYDVLAELTATAHAGMHRYTFPASKQSHLLVDLVHGLGNHPTEASVKIEGNRSISGYRRTDGWAKGRPIYFALECSKPFTGLAMEAEGKPVPQGQTEVKGTSLRMVIDFKTTNGEPVILRVGLSPTSVEDAKGNLAVEIPSWDFDGVRAAAKQTWNENLSRIRIESSSSNIRQIFYTAMYHTLTSPRLYNNTDHSYRGPDGATHREPGFNYYSTLSLWDTFRAEHPLLTITQPERVNDFVQSMLAFYQQSTDHALPMWPLDSFETGAMIGYNAVPVIYDAYAKGFRGFDTELAYKAMKETAMSGRNRQDEYQKFGFVPWENGKTEATSRTLEFAYDDWCISRMAGALGKTEDAALFGKRAQNYRHVWDEKTGFFRSKQADGTYHEPFDPKEVALQPADAAWYYTEANAWQYLFAVMHDVPGMMELFGGRQAFIKRLDQLFNEDSDMPAWRIDVTGIIGQYAHGNEPCHHIPYLYALAGQPYKTAPKVRDILFTQYENTPDGICGNDDCGQISAWYVFSAMGFYPVNPASGIYVIGSPIVEKATIKLDPKFYKGGTFTVIAHDASRQNGYVQWAKLNGAPLNRPWITHEEIVNGGTLELQMGILPNKSWAAAE